MMQLSQIKVRAGGAAALVGVGVVVAACGSSGAATPTTTANGGAAVSTGTTAIAAARGTAIATTRGAAGTFLTAAGGRAVYLWVADGHGMSRCSGACAQVWPPVTTKSTPIATGNAIASHLGTIRRANGAKQVTYDHHPLYYFSGDTGRRTTKGQGSDSFGAKWWLVAPAGTAITSGGSHSATPSSTKSSSSSSGGW
jgi:predicted lipoprotein with Yx(FWY)xxD motif